MACSKRNENRVATGNWRPFRPAGMTDRAWETILKVHRYPNAGMSAEERRHCLGPLLFGKGGPRFSGYGRGWIQSAADSQRKECSVKSPRFLDAKDCPAIKEAIDYYNGGDYDWACENGFDQEAVEELKGAIEYLPFWVDEGFDKVVEFNWYRLSYGAFGGAIEDATEQWVESGSRGCIMRFDSKDFDINDAFENLEGCDGHGVDCCRNVRDLNEATNLCPIYPNKSLFSGIECAIGWARASDLGEVEEKKIRRFLKRAVGELCKRRDAVAKASNGVVGMFVFNCRIKECVDDIANLFPAAPLRLGLNMRAPDARSKVKIEYDFGEDEEMMKEYRARWAPLRKRVDDFIRDCKAGRVVWEDEDE